MSPRRAWRLVREAEQHLESDPVTQLKFHLAMSYVWLVNGLFAVCVFFLARSVWDAVSVFYLVLVSLYANFATDFGAVSAAEAAIDAAKARRN